MSVVIRLAKVGKKGNRIYRVVAVDKRRERDSIPLAILGSYTPDGLSNIDEKQIAQWQAKGATLSMAVRRLLAQK